MGFLNGKDGQVKIGATKVASIDSWGGQFANALEEVTALGDEASRFEYGLKDAKGNGKGTFDSADAQQLALLDQFMHGVAPAKVDLHLVISGASEIYGSALISGITIDEEAGKTVKFSFDFQFDGAPYRK